MGVSEAVSVLKKIIENASTLNLNSRVLPVSDVKKAHNLYEPAHEVITKTRNSRGTIAQVFKIT